MRPGGSWYYERASEEDDMADAVRLTMLNSMGGGEFEASLDSTWPGA